jgi:hypothetical protein
VEDVTYKIFKAAITMSDCRRYSNKIYTYHNDVSHKLSIIEDHRPLENHWVLGLGPSARRNLQFWSLVVSDGVVVTLAVDVAVGPHHRGPEERAGFRAGKVHRDVALSPENRHDVHVAVAVDGDRRGLFAAVDLFEDLVLEELVGDVVVDLALVLRLRRLLVRVAGALLQQGEDRPDDALDLVHGRARLLRVEAVVVGGVVVVEVHVVTVKTRCECGYGEGTALYTVVVTSANP